MIGSRAAGYKWAVDHTIDRVATTYNVGVAWVAHLHVKVTRNSQGSERGICTGKPFTVLMRNTTSSVRGKYKLCTLHPMCSCSSFPRIRTMASTQYPGTGTRLERTWCFPGTSKATPPHGPPLTPSRAGEHTTVVPGNNPPQMPTSPLRQCVSWIATMLLALSPLCMRSRFEIPC